MELGRRIEEASLNAWPTLQQVLLDGWMLRFSGGYSKRANAVISFYSGQLESAEKIPLCEAQYAAWGLPTIFRVTPFAPPELDHLLEARNYRRDDPTVVMCGDMATMLIPKTLPADLHAESVDEWLQGLYHLSEAGNDGQEYHEKILRSIPVQRLLASLKIEGVRVACGLGVLEREFLGLFSLVTGKPFRRRGFGTQLLGGMLAWALNAGAALAYLQVREGNSPAISLYHKLGFQELYRYWYRIQPAEAPS